jgi:hypothetical protein
LKLPKLQISALVFLLGAIAIAPSCQKKGCTDSTATNYDEKADKEDEDSPCTFATATPIDTTATAVDPTYSVPTTYTFTDGSGNNTVSFGGQQQRLEMLSEMAAYMKTGNTSGTTVSAATLKSMYANSAYTWADAGSLGMTGSSKQLKSKTAENDLGIQTQFENLMDSIGSLSASTTAGQENGTSGTGGVYPNDGVKGPYLMSATGIEYMQLVEKGLMCAVFMNQLTINYLGGIGSDDNIAASDASAGKYYTIMEHHWDEAYGYFTSTTDYPSTGTDRFWGKYANKRESILGSQTKIANAFRTGRAAISNNDYTVRDTQVGIILTEIEKVCAASAIHYLNEAKENISNPTARNHQLSEAWAFANGLRFGYNSVNGVSISASEVDQVLAYIGTDFNAVSIIGIQSAIDLIASKTGLTNSKSTL